MAAKSTKPKSATSFKETAFGILPRSKVVTLEQEGIKKTQQYILKLSNKRAEITPKLICDIHQVGFSLYQYYYYTTFLPKMGDLW